MIQKQKRDAAGFLSQVDKILRKYSLTSGRYKIANAARTYGLKEEYLQLINHPDKTDEIVLKVTQEVKEACRLKENQEAYKMF